MSLPVIKPAEARIMLNKKPAMIWERTGLSGIKDSCIR